MIHGVIGVCSKTGRLLFSKKYSPSYGLPASPETESIDSHKLAALIFAFQLNANACLVQSQGEDSSESAPLKFLKFGNKLKIFFQAHPTLRNLVVALFVEEQMQEEPAHALLKNIFLNIDESSSSKASVANFLSGKLQGSSEVLKASMKQFAHDVLSQLMLSLNNDKKKLVWGWASLTDQDNSVCCPGQTGQDVQIKSKPQENVHELADLTSIGVPPAIRPSLEGDTRKSSRSQSRASCYSMFLPSMKRKRNSHPAVTTAVPSWCRRNYVWVDMQEDDHVVLDSAAKVAQPWSARMGPTDELLRSLVEILAERTDRVLVSGFSVKQAGGERLDQTKRRRKDGTFGEAAEEAKEESHVGCFLGLRSRASKKQKESADMSSTESADQVLVVTLDRLVVATGIKQDASRNNLMFEDEDGAESTHGLPWLFDKVNAGKYEELRQTTLQGRKCRNTGKEIVNFERNLLLLNDFLSFLHSKNVQT